MLNFLIKCLIFSTKCYFFRTNVHFFVDFQVKNAVFWSILTFFDQYVAICGFIWQIQAVTWGHVAVLVGTVPLHMGYRWDQDLSHGMGPMVNGAPAKAWWYHELFQVGYGTKQLNIGPKQVAIAAILGHHTYVCVFCARSRVFYYWGLGIVQNKLLARVTRYYA